MRLEFLPPKNEAEVLSFPLWWTMQFYVGNFGFSCQSVSRLAQAGLSHFKNLWDESLL